MNQPIRLLDSSRNPRSRELLRAHLEDRPSPTARRAAALALGIGASVTVTASASATGAAASATASALAAPSLGLIAAKWIAIGTLGGVALAGGASAISTSGQPAITEARSGVVLPAVEPAVAPEPAPSFTARGAHEPPSEAQRVVALPEPRTPSDSAVKVSSRAVSSSRIATAVAPALPASATLPEARGLAQEVAEIDAARRALAGGDATLALRHLDAYSALARTGTLDREAQLLRIDAFLLGPDRARGAALAEQYLARYPQDPHAARLRALLGDRSSPAATTPK
jgi:hypothetical protein